MADALPVLGKRSRRHILARPPKKDGESLPSRTPEDSATMSNSNTQPLAPALIGDVDLSIEAEPLRPPSYIKLGAPLPFRVPTRPEEITMDWLTDAFRFKGYLTRDGRVKSMTLKAIGERLAMFPVEAKPVGPHTRTNVPRGR